MSYTVRLRRSNVTVYTFTTTPFVSPELTVEYDDNVPPAVVGVRYVWRIRGKLYGSGSGAEAATITAYDALRTFFDGSSSLPDGIELLRDGSVVESITTAGGYSDFRLVSLSSPESDLQWRGEMLFTAVFEGVKRVATSGTIARLRQTDSFAYSPSGLLTRTLEGELEVTTGSAEDVARTLGLELPGQDYAYVTNGPEHVDVTVLDLAGRKASFRSVIAESGALLPSQVTADFDDVVETVVEGGKQSVNRYVTAEGVGAESAVRALLPAGDASSYVLRVSRFRRTASAVIRSTSFEDPKTGSSYLVTQTWETEVSGSETAWTKRTGGRKPLRHELARGPVEVTEQIRIEFQAPTLPPAAQIKFPLPVSGLFEDKSRWRLSGPDQKPGAQESGTQWTVGIRRVYSAAGLDEVASRLIQAMVAPGDSATLASELARNGGSLE